MFRVGNELSTVPHSQAATIGDAIRTPAAAPRAAAPVAASSGIGPRAVVVYLALAFLALLPGLVVRFGWDGVDLDGWGLGQARDLTSMFTAVRQTLHDIEFGSGLRFWLGVSGTTIYDFGLPTPRGTYAPNPHYAYLGAPVGRSGGEAASIAGTIYRNVWLSNRPRPDSLGSALQ